MELLIPLYQRQLTIVADAVKIDWTNLKSDRTNLKSVGDS